MTSDLQQQLSDVPAENAQAHIQLNIVKFQLESATASLKTAADIDTLRAEKVRLVDLDNGEIVVLEERLISPQIRAMIDNICYMSVYGHRSMLESRLPD